MSLILPTKAIAPTSDNPRLLMFYSTPKAGKTTILAGLENNLIIDLEGGADFISALKVDGTTFEKLKEIKAALLAPDAPKYDYISLDPITRLEDIALDLARQMYVNSPQGKNFDLDNILYLPNGAGYFWLRQAFELIVFGFKGIAPVLILSGHLREKMLEKGGKEVSFKEIDLTGKLRSIMSAHADAIGLLYRKGPHGIMSFKRTGEDVIVGARPKHLRDAEIIISDLEEDGSVTTHWDRIFLPN